MQVKVSQHGWVGRECWQVGVGMDVGVVQRLARGLFRAENFFGARPSTAAHCSSTPHLPSRTTATIVSTDEQEARTYW